MMGNEGGGRAACSTKYGGQTGACGSHLALDQLAPRERPSPWLEASMLGSSQAVACVSATWRARSFSRLAMYKATVLIYLGDLSGSRAVPRSVPVRTVEPVAACHAVPRHSTEAGNAHSRSRVRRMLLRPPTRSLERDGSRP